MISLLISIIPIAFLIWMMTKKNAVPSHIALPLTAFMVALIQFFHFDTDMITIGAYSVSGMLSATTPISIVAGAILLNRLLYYTGSEKTIKVWLESISRNEVAQLMIIGWAFAFMIEGASGFGTPAAIAAPILVGLGFSPIKVVLFTLTMNSVPVSFGAVGTPTWFGFSNLGLSEEDIIQTAQFSALIHLVSAFIIPLIALKFVVPWEKIKSNYKFILASTLSCTIPYFHIAQWNYEFPALIGGAIGLLITIFIAKKELGLEKQSDTSSKISNSNLVSNFEILKAISPTLLLIFILIITRVKQFGIKQLLLDDTSILNLSLGLIGDLSISQAFIIKVSNILGTSASWSYKLLYVPALIPFVLIVVISIFIFNISSTSLKRICSDTTDRIKYPFIALVGALIMVKLMMLGGSKSPIMTIGTAFSEFTGENWQYLASYLGALGAFFSGSATVSNLTFGGIQQSIAINVGLEESKVLALQSVGGAMGNMICINNIIAVSTILGISRQEGYILKRTIVPMTIYGLVAALMSYFI